MAEKTAPAYDAGVAHTHPVGAAPPVHSDAGLPATGGVGGVGAVGQSGFQQPMVAPQQQGHAGAPGQDQYAFDEGMRYQQSLMAQCARGNHQLETKYGIVGILIAVICCPCGLIALCIDRKKVCTRCGVVVKS